MLKKLARLFLLHEPEAPELGEPVWRQSALRIILISGICLEFLVAAHSSWQAIGLGLYHIPVIVTGFYLLLAAAIYAALRNVRLGAGFLLLTIYAASLHILFFVDVFEIAKLGIIFAYSAPLVARLFFGMRSAVLMMLLNTLLFAVLLRNQPLLNPLGPQYSITLPESHAYIQTLVFLFFNLCVPLAVFRALQALEFRGVQLAVSNQRLSRSNSVFRDMFDHSGMALLICGRGGHIIKANTQAAQLLGGSSEQLEEGQNMQRYLGIWGRKPEELGGERQVRRPDGQLRWVTVQPRRLEHDGNFLVILRDDTPLREAKLALARSAANASYLELHDTLTGLPNRQYLRQRFEELGQAGEERAWALLNLRLTNLRAVNDRLGPAIGDALLRAYGQALAEHLPADAFLARTAGVTFALLLPLEPGEAPEARARGLLQQLPRELALPDSGLAVPVPVAVGVTAARLDEGADEALQRVQTALELARNLPEGSVAVLDQEMEQRHNRQLDLELALRELDDSGLELVYQPKCLADGKVLGFEALLRWQHPRLGAVSPAEFIPLAERTGLMHRLTDFVLEQVCRQLQRWQGEGCRLLPVAINLSALDIVRPDIVHRLGETLARHHIPPALVEIEITETGLIRDERLAVENAQALRERGFALLIDDFGTGYSSLSKLNEFPVSAIKIDRTFIADLPGQEKKALIVKSILSLSRVLGCATVAEGVETREQLDFLTALGCTAYQGYYFHRPLPATTAGGLLERQPGPAPGEALMSPQPA